MSRRDGNEENLIVAVAMLFDVFEFTGNNFMVPVRFIIDVGRYFEIN